MPFCADCREHNVDRRANADHIKVNFRSGKLLGMCLHDAALNDHLRAERAHAFNVLVNGPLADGTAPRQRDFRMAIAAEHRPKKIIRSAQAAHHIKRDRMRVDFFGVNPHRAIRRKLHIRAHMLENLLQDPYILDLRQVLHKAAFSRQNNRGDDRYRSVFRTADGHAAFQPVPAVYHIMRHRFSFMLFCRASQCLQPAQLAQLPLQPPCPARTHLPS